MQIVFDPAKDELNCAKHGISLARAEDFSDLLVKPDRRFDYGEERFRGWGHIDGSLYCVAFTTRNGVARIISLRRTHKKEYLRHVEKEGS